MHLFLSLKIQTEASLNGPPLDLKPSACLQPEYKFSTILSSVTMASLQRQAAQMRALWSVRQPALRGTSSSFPLIWLRNKEPKKNSIFSKLSSSPLISSWASHLMCLRGVHICIRTLRVISQQEDSHQHQNDLLWKDINKMQRQVSLKGKLLDKSLSPQRAVPPFDSQWSKFWVVILVIRYLCLSNFP